MENQIIIINMHTLNKYNIPCVDAIEYLDCTGLTQDNNIFYLKKNKYTYLVKAKLTPYKLYQIDEFTICDYSVWDDDFVPTILL